MLYDRNYMRNPLKEGFNSVVDKLIITLVATFIVRFVLTLFLDDYNLFIDEFSLSIESLSNGYIWSGFTYIFIHQDIIHLLLNLLLIHFVGRQTEIILGPQNFTWLCFLGAVSGGLFWLCFNYDSSGGVPRLIGASAVCMSCLTYFCLYRPNEEISMFLFFILPVRLKPKYILWGILAIELTFFVNEIKDENQIDKFGTAVAHSAHLGGMLMGFLYFYFSSKGFSFPRFKFRSKKKDNLFKFNFQKTSKTVDNNEYKVNISNYVQLQKEVDRILDKINDLGFGSLTANEKDTLEKAKNLLHKN